MRRDDAARQIRELLADGAERYAVEIADAIGVPVENFRRVLVTLEEGGVVTSRIEGSGPKRKRFYKLAEG